MFTSDFSSGVNTVHCTRHEYEWSGQAQKAFILFPSIISYLFFLYNFLLPISLVNSCRPCFIQCTLCESPPTWQWNCQLIIVLYSLQILHRGVYRNVQFSIWLNTMQSNTERNTAVPTILPKHVTLLLMFIWGRNSFFLADLKAVSCSFARDCLLALMYEGWGIFAPAHSKTVGVTGASRYSYKSSRLNHSKGVVDN